MSNLSYYELVSALLSLTVGILGARQRILAWPINLLANVLSFYLHWTFHLPHKCLLNVFKFINSIYGWNKWRYGGKNKTPLQVTRITLHTFIFVLISGLIGTLSFGYFSSNYLNSSFPYWGAYYASFTLLAHWLLARKVFEAWFLFLLTDLVHIYIYFQAGRYFFGVKTILYFFIILYGMHNWWKAYKNNEPVR